VFVTELLNGVGSYCVSLYVTRLENSMVSHAVSYQSSWQVTYSVI
jgi:hypothetical protein